MKLPDVNIWLACALSGHTHHQAARSWLDDQRTRACILFCRATQQGLVRLLTTPAVLSGYGLPPLTNRQAWSVFEQFMADDRFTFAVEPVGIEALWKDFALRESPSPKLWMDAWLAAFAVCSGFQLVTIDKAFTQFAGLDLKVIVER
jgi:uncharacterized protein